MTRELNLKSSALSSGILAHESQKGLLALVEGITQPKNKINGGAAAFFSLGVLSILESPGAVTDLY